MSTPDIAAAMAAENRRRQLADQSPGLGASMVLPDLPYYSHGLGPVIGEGHEQTAPVADAVHKAYGEPRPVCAASEVGGLGSAPGGIARPALRSDRAALADQVFAPQGAHAADAGPVVISPAAAGRPGLLARPRRR